MNTIVLDDQRVHIPTWVDGLDSCRRWLQSNDFPEDGRICYLDGDVWIDISREQIFSHNQVKDEFNVVVGAAVKQQRVGRYYRRLRYLFWSKPCEASVLAYCCSVCCRA